MSYDIYVLQYGRRRIPFLNQADQASKMIIELRNLCDYAGTNLQERKYVEGHRIYNTKNEDSKIRNIYVCGLVASNNSNLKVYARCLKTSSLRDGYHEINGEVKVNKKILYFNCSCPAGNSGQCKHILGVLFFCLYHELEELSSTSLPCAWKQQYKEAQGNYDPIPLEDHSCFSELPPAPEIGLIDLTNINKQMRKNSLVSKNKLSSNSKSSLNSINTKSKKIKRVKPAEELSKEVCDKIKSMFDSLLKSSLAKAEKGRHKPVTVKEKSKVSSEDREVYKIIFEKQDSNLMEVVSKLKVGSRESCCQAALEKLFADGVTLCENTRNWFAQWLCERQYRVTGSICYALYTYTKNNNPDWENKCKAFIEPKNFKTEATEYGNKYEAQARDKFKFEYPEFQVIETGLIINQVNPWLAVTPDGVLVKNGQLQGLLEIKCPIDGKTKTITETVQNQIKNSKGYLVLEGENIALKKNHSYYAQVQLGMAVLNVTIAYFVLHSTFDNKIHVTKVAIDKLFLVGFLGRLKKMYYSIMLPEICLRMVPVNSTHVNKDHFKFNAKYFK